MKIWISIFVTSIGFLLGLVLAGIGGLSAAESLFKRSEIENTKILEKYWSETGLSVTEVSSLITNDKCSSSEKYHQACVNAVVQNSQLVRNQSELSEKMLLQKFLASKQKLNFQSEIEILFDAESPLKRADLAAKLINSFLSVYFDPHTYIMPANYFKEVSSRIDRSKYFVGISYERKNGDFFIRKVSKNSDADQAGLKSSDKIVSINGVNLHGLKYDEVSKLLKDEDEKVLNFKLVRRSQDMHIALVRSYRFLSHVQYDIIKAEKNYGLITLSKFNKGACHEITEHLKTSSKNQVAGIILDLRDNPGGFLDEAACIAGLFLGKNKKAYYVEYLDPAKPNEVVLTSEEQVYQGPLIVMVNSTSASASESLAGAIQDYRRGLIVGERTFGKGTFQEPEEWLVNSKIKLFKTQGYYLLPSRNSAQLVGIRPNVELGIADPQKREASYFFNPLKSRSPKYSQLKKSELVKNFNYANCSEVMPSSGGEDAYLQRSLAILGCVKKKEIVVAQSAGSILN